MRRNFVVEALVQHKVIYFVTLAKAMVQRIATVTGPWPQSILVKTRARVTENEAHGD